METTDKLTLKEFQNNFMRKGDVWPVGVRIELKNGHIHTVGTVNPNLVSTYGKINEDDIGFVILKGAT